MKNTEHTQQWLTVEEIAEEARVTELTVRRWIAAGMFASHKLGGIVRVKREDFDAWVDSGRREAS